MPTFGIRFGEIPVKKSGFDTEISTILIIPIEDCGQQFYDKRDKRVAHCAFTRALVLMITTFDTTALYCY